MSGRPHVAVSATKGGLLVEVDGEHLRAGRAASRCFHDLERQFSREEALTVAGEAVARMPDVRRLWPKSPQSGNGQINVNGFLLALGFDERRVEELGAHYRSGASATIDLRSAGASIPSTPIASLPRSS